MKLTLQDLKNAMSPLSEIGKGELTFDVNGIAISLRALSPDEEIQIQRYARQAVADGDYSDQASALEYLDRFRISALGYSIVQVGDFDFRKAEFVETGEKLPNGTAIKIRKHEAVMQIISGWSRNMINAVFKKFSELANKVEAEVEGLIEFDEIDYDAEIARAEERIRELRDAKNKHALSTRDPRSDLRKQVAASGKTFAKADNPQPETNPANDSESVGESASLALPIDVEREVIEESYEESYEESEDSDNEFVDDEEEEDEDDESSLSPESAPSNTRTSVFDRAKGVLSPPHKPVPASVESAPSVAKPSAPKEEPNPPTDTAALPERFEDVTNSLINTSDPDEMNRAIEEENRRLAQRRARAVAPHLAAKQVSDDLGLGNPPPAQAVLAGKKDGMEVYKMPTQTMTDRKAPVSAAEKAPKPTSNPKFRPVR